MMASALRLPLFYVVAAFAQSGTPTVTSSPAPLVPLANICGAALQTTATLGANGFQDVITNAGAQGGTGFYNPNAACWFVLYNPNNVALRAFPVACPL